MANNRLHRPWLRQLCGLGIARWITGTTTSFGLAGESDNGASPGTVLTGTVKISPQPDEDRYDDNEATWVEVLNSSGPTCG